MPYLNDRNFFFLLSCILFFSKWYSNPLLWIESLTAEVDGTWIGSRLQVLPLKLSLVILVFFLVTAPFLPSSVPGILSQDLCVYISSETKCLVSWGGGLEIVVLLHEVGMDSYRFDCTSYTFNLSPVTHLPICLSHTS